MSSFDQRITNLATRLGCLTAALAFMLTACAQPAPPAAPAVAQIRQSGEVTMGTVLAVRQTNSAMAAGLADVMAALNQPLPATPAAAREIVIRKDDGNTVTLSQPGQAPLAIGARIVILAGDPTTLAAGN